MIFQPIQIAIHSQQSIQLTFSSPPSLFLTKQNFTITSTFSGVNDLDILSIDINGVSITITTRPMFANNLYLLQLLDLPTQPFEDINNIELSTLPDSRSIYFVGVEEINSTRDTMLQNLPSNYDTTEQTLVYDVTATIANEINTASITLEEIKNDNFISIPINDELYYRGNGPTDRLNNEGVYSVLRVAKTITGTTAAGLKSFDPTIDPNIPFEIINLRVMQITETVPNGIFANSFDGFLITVNHHYVTRLISVLLNPGNIAYDPTKYGYALLNNSYDRLARSSSILQNNQILLSPLTNGVFAEPIPGDILTVVYEFDNVGRRIDKSSVQLFSVLEQINEGVSANVTNFFLDFANIVSQTGQIIVRNGVNFNISTINLNKHPAFLHELVFNPDSLPSAPGEYAVDYSTGQVFVFGTQHEIGTGMIPPVATYYYKDVAVSNVDYFISDDGYNVRLNQFSQFANQPFIITFEYEDVFTPGIDYAVSSHVEVLQERVENRLTSDFTIEVLNGPVKDVYQILNETTGESYTPGLIEGNQISFAGNKPPTTSITTGELAQAAIVGDEVLNVLIPTTTPNGLIRVFPIALKNHPVLNQRQDGIGSNFNSSIQLTRSDLFLNEFYFNSFESITINLDKLKNIGDYLVDYANGNIYLAVASNQNFDIGHISYAYGAFIPSHKHVLGVSSIGLGTTSTHIINEYELGIIEDGLIIPKQLDYGYDFFDGKTLVPNSNLIFVAQLQDDFTVYTGHPIKKIYGVFTQNSVDAYNISTLATKNLFNSAVNTFDNTLIDLKTYTVLPVQSDVNPNYYHVIINDVASDVKSIVVVDTGVQLVDSDLHVVKYNNIIIKSVVAVGGSATISLQNTISLNTNNVGVLNSVDYLIDIANNQFTIQSITGSYNPVNSITTGNTIIISYTGAPPIANIGSQILDQNGIIVAQYLNIISVTELPDLLYILHYDVFPDGIQIGYQVKDSNGNIFAITDVQSTSVVVSVTSTVPVIDPVAKVETQSLLLQSTPIAGQTTLMLPLDAPIAIGTNLNIGYVPKLLNDEIVAANVHALSAGGAGMVIDYSIGQFFLGYRHLDDELLVSYDWGDNQLDWSISDALSTGDPYYVSYKYGASRDGLETNFGPLTNVSFLQNAPLSIDRETYRTAVSAAIKAFLKGPTHEAIRLLAHSFTQIDPDIEESSLNQWIVGRDPLSLQAPIVTGKIGFGNGKYNEGLVITENNSIQLPGESSIRLAQGTFSTWFRPNWNGNQADEQIVFNLPTAVKSVYYNAYGLLPTDVSQNPWFLVINSDAYGTALVSTGFLEIRNSKNEYTSSFSDNYDDGYIYDGYTIQDGYDGYEFSSTLGFHQSFTSFAYSNRIGKYLWSREEIILSIANDLDVNFIGYVSQLNYVNPVADTIQTANVVIDDGYSKYSTGLYLHKRNLYTANIVLEDVHLDIVEPFPQFSPPIYVSTNIGSPVVNVITGDISTLSLGQQLIIGIAYPEVSNIIGFGTNTIIMRNNAQATLTNVLINNLDPQSTLGTQDGYGEVHLQDKLGTRPSGTIVERTNGWERQLLVKVQLAPLASGHLMILGSDDLPLTTQTPVVDFLDSIIPGTDVFVDGYGNVFEVDNVELPYVWLKKPSASGAPVPLGALTAFRKIAGVQLPDGTMISVPVNWSQSIQTTMQKRSGSITFTADNTTVNSSYISHVVANSSGTPNIAFGSIDLNVDSIIRVQSVNYNVYSIFGLTDIYIGNTGFNPTSDIMPFKYDIATTGVPAINTNKYFAIFTSENSAATDEPVDEVFVKMKIPSSWILSDGLTSLSFSASPTIMFTASTTGDFIDLVVGNDGYMKYQKGVDNIITLTAKDGYTYVPGNSSILLDGGPELRIAAGKRHFLFDTNTDQGALRLYRSGDGHLTAEVQLFDPQLLNIRSDISLWKAGELHHIAMSWKIDAPDETDELHLFIDGDEVPNEVTFGSEMLDGEVGQIYEEKLTINLRQNQISQDGYIWGTSNILGSGLFIPSTASIQPSTTWINKTIVMGNAPDTSLHLLEPLIVGALTTVPGGVLLLLSKNGQQLSFPGTSTPTSYGLATYAIAQTTILVRTNFGVFKNDGYSNVELDGPYSIVPEFRQVSDTQVIEFYYINTTTGEYTELTNITTSTITIRTYGLLAQRINDRVFQFGSLIRKTPIVVQMFAGQFINTDVTINNNGPAFQTSLPAPADPTQVTVTKVLLPKVII